MLGRKARLAVAASALSAGVAVAWPAALAEDKPSAPAPVQNQPTAPSKAVSKKLDIQIMVPPALMPSKADADAHEPPKPPQDGQAAKTPPPVPLEWTPTEIVAAQARCTALLKTVDAITMPEPPVRSGSCGAPAPVRLISVGKNPEVALDPPPLLTCEMVATLAHWIKTDVQPLAKKYLGDPVIKIGTMSDYSCRAAYGRKGNRLSEHGRANALDIRGFVTGKGKFATVLSDWGMTQRDVARAVAAAKAAAAKAEQERAAAAAKEGPAPVAPSKTTNEATGAIASPARANNTAAPAAPSPANSGTGFMPANLGGPKPEKTAALPAEPEAKAVSQPMSKSGVFLREAHASACRIFGTTLGPEANEAHRNHFHVDMAERKNSLRICDH